MRPLSSLVLLLALGAGDQGKAVAPPPEGVVQEARDILLLRAADLPRAEPGSYPGWSEASGIEKDLEAVYFAAARAWQEQDPRRVLLLCWGILEQHPGHPAFLHLAGHAAFRLRRYGECVELLTRFLEMAPGEVARTRHLAHAWSELGAVDLAEAHYRAVLALAPDETMARHGLALVLWRQGKGDGARALLGEILAQHSEHQMSWTLLARILWDAEDLEPALRAAERALALDPFDPSPAYLRARILAELGPPEQARSAEHLWHLLEDLAAKARPLEARLLLDPRDQGALRDLANLRLAAGDARGARSTLEALGRLARASGDEATLAFVRQALRGPGGTGSGD